MAFVQYNANPFKNDTIDCVIRGISKVMDITWDEAYIRLFVRGYMEKEMPMRNDLWIDFLLNHGFKIEAVPNTCPKCITVKQFAEDHPKGRYLLGTGSHVIAIEDGDYYDTWDSGSERPIYYLERRKGIYD